MTLGVGSRLGPYEIVSHLGAGGMGEVYRARDPRLGRDVAVKVIAARIADDPSALARFEREARAIARLSHPNIVAIHDIGQEQGVTYAVMELLPGEALRVRLLGGALPVRKAIDIATSIARGLGAAHEAGIVHRDLKPENVFVLPDGQVKILDFGLAQALAPDESGASSTTKLDLLTAPGTVFGTPAYMAPEQIQGLRVDGRCDIFALGTMLFEMLSGRRPFAGNSSLDVMHAIVHDEPAPAALADLPGPIRRIMLRCLEKQPQDRFSSARDLAFALEAAAETGSSGGTVLETPHARPTRTRRLLAWAALAAGLGLAVVARHAWMPRAALPTVAPAVRSMRLLLQGPPGYINSWQFSPDGRMLAALVRAGTPRRDPGASDLERAGVWVCDLISAEWRQLAPTNRIDEHLSALAWSPDGKSVLFQAVVPGAIELRSVDVSSRALRPLGRLDGTRGAEGATWSRESGIVIGGRTLRILSPESGAVTDLLPENAAVSWRRWPWFLDDGRTFVFTQDGHSERERGIFLGHVGSTGLVRLLPVVSNAIVTRLGSLVYADGGTLLAVSLDLTSERTVGTPRPVATRQVTYEGYTWFAVSSTDALALGSIIGFAPSELSVFDRTGRKQRGLGTSDDYAQIELSPDQRSLAVQVRGELGVVDIERGVYTPVIGPRPKNPRDSQDTTGWFFGPVWHPGGQTLAASWSGDLIRVDLATRDVKTMLVGPGWYVEAWSRDGREFLVGRDGAAGSVLWALPADHLDAGRPITQEGPFDVERAQYSPVDHWIAYNSNETGTAEVYLQSLDATGDRRRVSPDGGVQPRWRADGRELFYLRPDGMLMAAAISRTMEPGTPAALFLLRAQPAPNLDQYVAFAQGQKFIGIQPATTAPERVTLVCTDVGCPALTILTNWPNLLER